MNRIFVKAVSAIASLALIASCSKEAPENPYAHTSSISIESSEILFPEEGGDGLIKVACESDFTVSCDASWISFQKVGTIVMVTATANPSISGRSASIILTCGEDQVKAVAQQVAFAFVKEIPESLDLDDNAASYSYEYKAPYTVNVKTSASWINARMEGNNLKVSLPANKTGVARIGKIYLTGGDELNGQVDSISISQFDFDGKVGGQYYMEYSSVDWDDDEGDFLTKQHKDVVEINRDPQTHEVSLDLPSGYSVPLEFDAQKMRFNLMALTYCGMEKSGSTTLYLYITLVDKNHHVQIFGDGFGMYADIETVKVNGEDKVYLEFKDNGKWDTVKSGYAATCFYIYRFTTTPSYSSAAGHAAEFANPVLTRI